jgi:hypothetical protein
MYKTICDFCILLHSSRFTALASAHRVARLYSSCTYPYIYREVFLTIADTQAEPEFVKV